MMSFMNFFAAGMFTWAAVFNLHYKRPNVAALYLGLAVFNFGMGIKNAIMELN